MEQLEQQKATLKLGKLLVKELGAERDVDTLSKWMAHFIAEKINHIESLADERKKSIAEKECFSLILDLWKHRWYYKSNRQPLRDFKHLFEILESVDPEKARPHYYGVGNLHAMQEEEDEFDPLDLKNLTSLSLQIDKVARIWINYLLRQAASMASDKKTKELIEQAIKLPDSTDAKIINIVMADNFDDDLKVFDSTEFERKSKIKTLDRRIVELKKFREINEYLITQFEKESRELKGEKNTKRNSKDLSKKSQKN